LISRQKLVGWVLVVFSAAYLAYFTKTRLLEAGPALVRKEWLQFAGMVVILMLGTANIRLAAMRERNRKARESD
jgi:hypothetical protein